MNTPQLWWFTTRAGGIIAWTLLTATVVWGLLLRTRIVRRTPPRPLLELHRFLAGLAVAFTVVHTISLLLDTYVRFDILDLLVPFAASWRPVPVAFGVLALYLLIAIVVTSALRRRLSRTWWHRVHLGAYLLFWLATAHLLTAGTDASQPALRLLVIGAIVSVLFLSLLRVFLSQPAPRRPVAAATAPAIHPLRVTQIRRETRTVTSVLFAIPPGLASAYRYQPGQHVTVGTRIDGMVIRRPYSICTDSDETGLRIAVKHVAGGRMSTWIHTGLHTGDLLDVSIPSGVFTTRLDPARARHVLAIAAGSGITPLITLISSVLAGEPLSRCTLIYGNRTRTDILFAERLTHLEHRYRDRLRIVYLLSGEQPVAPMRAGRIGADTVAALLPSAEGDRIDDAFLCGPADMTTQIRPALLRHGLDADRIHVEHFAAPPTSTYANPAVERVASSITIVHNGLPCQVAALPGETVLDSGLRAGLDLPYSCRSGICGTCRALIIDDGDTRGASRAEPEVVLACQTHLRRDAVADFDAERADGVASTGPLVHSDRTPRANRSTR